MIAPFRKSTQHGRSQGRNQGGMHPIFSIFVSSYFVLWEAVSQTKYCCSPKIKRFVSPHNFFNPQKFWADYTCSATLCYGIACRKSFPAQFRLYLCSGVLSIVERFNAKNRRELRNYCTCRFSYGWIFCKQCSQTKVVIIRLPMIGWAAFVRNRKYECKVLEAIPGLFQFYRFKFENTLWHAWFWASKPFLCH